MFDRKIKVVSTPGDLTVYQELIYRVYCQELKWFESDNYPQGRVEDEFDAQSSHFLIIDNQSGEVMAGMRLIRSSVLGLPIFEKFGGVKVPNLEFISSRLGKEAKICDVEISQVAALQKFRERRLSFTIDIGKIVYQYCQQNNLEYMYFTIDLKFFLEAHKHHFLSEPIGIPRFYYGSWVMPCIVFFEMMSEHLRKNNLQAFNYIIDPNNLVGSLKDDNLQMA